MRQSGGRVFLYDVVDHTTLAVPEPPARSSCAVWDTCNAEVFLLAAAGGALQVYRYEAQSTRGPRVVRLAMNACSRPTDPIETPGKDQLTEELCAALSCQPSVADADPMGHQLGSGQPLLCRNGVLTFCGDDGQLRHGVLSTHSALQVPPQVATPRLGLRMSKVPSPGVRSVSQGPDTREHV